MTQKKIMILLHERDNSFERKFYLLKLLMLEWEKIGFNVEVIRGISRFVPAAAVVIPHLDITVTPDEYLHFLNSYPKVINGRVVDISKSRISGNLVGKNDPYSGPVIVKTNRNSGGLPEEGLFGKPRKRRHFLKRVLRRITSRSGGGDRKSVPLSHATVLHPVSYPVYSSAEEVPEEVFANTSLVVEKFMPEIDGDDYCVRYTYCLGKAEASLRLWSKEKVVKVANAHKIEEVPTPVGIDAIRQQLGFDYGKFDYVVRDGKLVLLDANRTPAANALRLSNLTQEFACYLARGIWSKLDN